MGQHSIGERFGDYKLVRPLGEGGFASVYLGEEVHNKTLAAVKLLKEQKVHDFINEVRRTVLLKHPNIVKILDFGIRKPDDTAFIVMEYAPNGSFREKFPRGTRVPLDVVIPTVKQVASALQYAHDQRVIHRDVKPENLLLNAQNKILLSDFGIATASLTSMKANTGQVGQGDIIGTYAYMAPEQLKGRPVPASDQYSLAIMVYEWLCGELPFEGREYIQWLNLHERVSPPLLRVHVPSLAPEVEQVVLRALAKKPEGRFERVETFALALARVARGEDVSQVMSQPGAIKQSAQFDSSPYIAPQPSKSIEQLFQEGVRAQSSGNVEEAFRIWRQMMTTSGVAERYSITARNRIRELRTQMIPLRLKQAREASMKGCWRDEIRLWEDLLALEPSTQDLAPLLKSPLTLGKAASNITQSIQERLQIAQQNEQSAWMYEGAQQFIHNKDNAAARTQLQMLWQDAPYYGDPSGLSKALGLPAVPNYEQAIAAEQVRLKQERERQEQERLVKERQERERQEQVSLMRHKQGQVIAKQKRNKRIFIIIMVAVVISGIAVTIAVVGVGAVVGGAALGGVLGGVVYGLLGGVLDLGVGVIVGGIVGGVLGVGLGLGALGEAPVGVQGGVMAGGAIVGVIVGAIIEKISENS